MKAVHETGKRRSGFQIKIRREDARSGINICRPTKPQMAIAVVDTKHTRGS